ncbi:hypothetical protein [Marinilabilia sp.]|uniref:hypothetical protein n=1 Tax=Marinilabilia sp. TaxID=2021252 RepID=UPI0025C54575|nr:hypothetical protein [Marinilabilia sp.]
MIKLINFIAGILAGVAPFVLASIFGILIFNELPNFIGIILCIILGLLAIRIGILIFKRIQRNGIFDFMSVVVASPDLDNLEPTMESQTKKRTPKELAELNQKGENLFKGGLLKIFGDWHGEPQVFLKISRIDFDELKNRMVIEFSPKTTLLIEEPGPVLESPSMLKILSAKRIKIEFQHKTENSPAKVNYFKVYAVSKNRIITETNIDWTKQKIDAAIGQDALFIFN